MRKIPISGGPHTGKTTLLEALREEFPDAHVVVEPAVLVMTEQREKEADDPSYKGIFPWDNYPAFARLAVDASLRLEASIPDNADLVFQDRSLIDNIAYGRLNLFTDLITEVVGHVRVARYALALFCEPVGVYTLTDVRRETPEEALRTHEHLADAYHGIPELEVVHLPAVSVADRIELIRDLLD